MPKVEVASEKDFTELTDTANRIFTGKTENGTFIYDKHFFQTVMSKLYRHEETAKEHLIIREDGKITGLVGVIRNQIYACGKTLNTAGIGTVGTDAQYRGRGYMSAMMNAAYSHMKETGTDVAFLGGNRQRYEHFGFTAAGQCASFEVTKDNICSIVKNSGYGYTFSDMTGNSAEIDGIYSIYEHKTVRFGRDKQKFADILHTWGSEVKIIYRDGKIVGYAVCKENGIFELEHKANCHLSEILHDFMKFYEKGHLSFCGVSLYDTEKFNLLIRCAESFSLQCPCRTLILNYENTIAVYLELKSSYSRLCDGKMNVRVSHETFTEQFEIAVNAGKVSVIPADGTPDITLPALEAAQVFFGNLQHDLPAYANSWFPLPLNIESADMV